MSRAGAVTFKGAPLTLAGNAVEVGQQGPDFTLHFFEDGMQTITPACLKGKASILSVVPSLDTPVCQTQTKKFNQELSALGDIEHHFSGIGCQCNFVEFHLEVLCYVNNLFK